MKKTILHSFIGAIVFSLTCFLILYAVKARQTTNPGLTEQSPVGGLYVNPGETLNAAKRNTLVDKANFIICYKNATSGGSTTAGVWSYTFTADDCGGTLPDSSYMGTLSILSINGTSFNLAQVLNTGEIGLSGIGTGPGIRSFANGTPNGAFIVRIVYFKK